ncbi:MAG: hypothetical protein AAGF25_01280 [Pseudomonadota bacterium]
MTKSRKRVRRPGETIQYRYDSGDYILGGILTTITLAAVIFPWHAYNYPAQYQRPQMVFTNKLNGVDLSQIDGTQTAFDLSTGEFVPTFDDGIDNITTAGVQAAEDSEAGADREILSADDFALIASDDRRALIESADGIYLVGPYSVLPDGSKVRALRSGQDGNRIITTRFEIIEPSDTSN